MTNIFRSLSTCYRFFFFIKNLELQTCNCLVLFLFLSRFFSFFSPGWLSWTPDEMLSAVLFHQSAIELCRACVLPSNVPKIYIFGQLILYNVIELASQLISEHIRASLLRNKTRKLACDERESVVETDQLRARVAVRGY